MKKVYEIDHLLYIIISIDCFPDMPVTATTDRCAQSGIFQVCIIIVGEYVTYPKVIIFNATLAEYPTLYSFGI